ncbi:fimbrial protein, partial [Salmonella enterica]|nr:fimbrial protein [Salmonella enterica]
MSRILMLLLFFCSGYFTVFPASADPGCTFTDGDQVYINVPQMALPADTPDGTVLYTSPKITKRIICESPVISIMQAVDIDTTADYNAFLSMM